MKEYVEVKLENSGILEALGNPEIRLIDLTDVTDDPGNTAMLIAFVPWEWWREDTWETRLKAFQAMLEDEFDSYGDHHEEVTVHMMNSEMVILFNFNK
jgi:hypothetical protein